MASPIETKDRLKPKGSVEISDYQMDADTKYKVSRNITSPTITAELIKSDGTPMNSNSLKIGPNGQPLITDLNFNP